MVLKKVSVICIIATLLLSVNTITVSNESYELERGNIYALSLSAYKFATYIKPGYTPDATVITNMGNEPSDFGITFTYLSNHNTKVTYLGQYGSLYIRRVN